MAADYKKALGTIGRGAKIAGATVVEAGLAATGLHPSLHGDDTWSLIRAARGGSVKVTDKSKNKKKGKGKLAKVAKGALGAIEGMKRAPLPPASLPEYHGTTASVTTSPYTGVSPTATLIGEASIKDEKRKGDK